MTDWEMALEYLAQRDAARAEVAQLKNALDLHAIAWTQGIPNYCLELAAERDAALADRDAADKTLDIVLRERDAMRAALRYYVEAEDTGLEDEELTRFSEMARAALDSPGD